MFKISKETPLQRVKYIQDGCLVPLLLTLNIFQILFYCNYIIDEFE